VSRPVPPGRSRFKAWHRVTLRWADNDAYGHVNNAIYYQWFDSAVNSLLVDHGLLDIGGGDPIALVVSTRCDYFSSLAFPGTADVGLGVADLGRSSVRYALGVFAEGAEEAAAAGEFVHVAVSRDGRRPMPWPESWRELLATLLVPQEGTDGQAGKS
jgi:acyl-CoA thioester hydrolase